ncbi:DUF6879 family protein [Streptacidiphilus monticola]|jgi:hypothetical protein
MDQGERLDQAEYLACFEELFWRSGPEGFWKLERLQHYQEPGLASWEAYFRDGDWDLALRLVEESRPDVAAHLSRIAAAGVRHHRVRVVERPLSPYLLWELHLLRLKDQLGENVRIVDDSLAGPLPELVVLGRHAVFDVRYTPDGLPDGAVRCTDPDTVAEARDLVRRLHRVGEPLPAFFAREVQGVRP